MLILETQIVSKVSNMTNPEIAEKDKILQFTHQLFLAEGFYKTSMDEIARELQISKKTIYKYFPSKDGLLEDVCELRMVNAEKMIDEIINTDEDAVTKFVKLVNMNHAMMKNCSEKWIKDLQLHAPHLMERFNKLRDKEIGKTMTRLIEQGRKEKLIENYPPAMIITAFLGAISFVTNPEFILNNKFSFQEAFRITADIFFKGFLTEQGKQKYTNTKKIFEKCFPTK